MHESVMEFLRESIQPDEIKGKKVLEVGSQDLNGSPRSIIEQYSPSAYIGIDSGPGKGVDLVLDACEVVRHFGKGYFDVVISTEMLEHAENWRSSISNMKRALKSLGLIVITTRSPGFPYHGHPGDYWRFTRNIMSEVFSDMSIKILVDDPLRGFPGIFMKAWKAKGIKEVDLTSISAIPAPPDPARENKDQR